FPFYRPLFDEIITFVTLLQFSKNCFFVEGDKAVEFIGEIGDEFVVVVP
ncbi:12523_t:CDS:1, partial [Funneliformis mosseae]